MTKPTKSFFYVLTGTAVFAFAAVLTTTNQFGALNPVASSAAETELVQDKSQEHFRNEDIGLAFDYPKGWEVSTSLTDDYFIIALRAAPITEPITIHVGGSYFGTDGLENQPMTIGGYEGLNIQNQIYAVHKNGSYYTFDLRSNYDQEAALKELIESVELF